MLDSLIESRHVTAYRGAFGGGAASVFVHSALIAGAVYATLQTRVTHDSPHIEIALPVLSEPPRPPAGDPGPSVLLPLPVRLAVSAVIPPVIPPPSSTPFDPTRFSGIGPDSGVMPGLLAPGAAVSTTEIYAPTMVEERPERIGGPEPRYPEMLRQAGIEGQVVVECVIDTLGRAEPGSIRVVASSHPLFDAPAREAVAASSFRPARLDGRAVRVRVQLPLNFRMARSGAGGP